MGTRGGSGHAALPCISARFVSDREWSCWGGFRPVRVGRRSILPQIGGDGRAVRHERSHQGLDHRRTTSGFGSTNCASFWPSLIVVPCWRPTAFPMSVAVEPLFLMSSSKMIPNNRVVAVRSSPRVAPARIFFNFLIRSFFVTTIPSGTVWPIVTTPYRMRASALVEPLQPDRGGLAHVRAVRAARMGISR